MELAAGVSCRGRHWASVGAPPDLEDLTERIVQTLAFLTVCS